MKRKWYDILDEMQELMYETDAAETAAELMYQALRDRGEELSEKMLYFMKKELERLHGIEKEIIKQMDVAIMEENKRKPGKV